MTNPAPDSFPDQPLAPPSVAPHQGMPPGPPVANGPLYRPPVEPPSRLLNPYDDKQWGTLAHFGGLAGFLPALVIYLNFKDRGRFARQESAEGLNFQITIAAAYFVCVVFSLIPFVGLLFSLAMLGLWIANIVLSIMSGLAASKGEPYRYPLALRLVS
jgi:uncharacterized Tic20 family protein